MNHLVKVAIGDVQYLVPSDRIPDLEKLLSRISLRSTLLTENGDLFRVLPQEDRERALYLRKKLEEAQLANDRQSVTILEEKLSVLVSTAERIMDELKQDAAENEEADEEAPEPAEPASDPNAAILSKPIDQMRRFELQHLAKRLGIATLGTKLEILQRITQELAARAMNRPDKKPLLEPPPKKPGLPSVESDGIIEDGEKLPDHGEELEIVDELPEV